MNRQMLDRLERRVLIRAPVGKDAALMESMLGKEGIPCFVCSGIDTLRQELDRGAAAVVMTEEAVVNRDPAFAALVMGQPAWSDLPLLLLTRPGSSSAAVGWVERTLGNVTLLERPVRVAALASALRSALRARERQYQTRAHLEERAEADRRKDEFLATLAHELRNPLAPIRNAVNILHLSDTGRSSAAALEMMDRQIDHMVRLVDDLMEVSRLTRGKIELRKKPVDLALVVATAVEASRPLIDSAGHELGIDASPRPLIVEGDAVRLAQVISNLLNNAVKYTDRGGRIVISTRRDEDEAVVTVADTGIGMSAESLAAVFDMFVQVDEQNNRAKAGLGIGLTLVRSLVEMHGGRATAASAGPGHGSEFAVRLPLMKDGVVRVQEEEAAARDIRGLPRVLVVDDNRDAADSLGAVLQMLGAEVRVTHDGRAALAEVDEFRPAAVFLDLGMPGMDGYEVASRIRAGSARDTRLIAVTGWGQERDRRQTHEAGFDDHVVKPPDIDDLQAVLASLSDPNPETG